jgi:hypothetical protein
MKATRKTAIIVENFYEEPLAVREFALHQRYYYPYQRNDDVRAGVAPKWISTWFKESRVCPFKSSHALVKRLEHLTNDVVDMDHWNASFPLDDEGKAAPDCEAHERTCLWNCCFHVKPETDQRLGEGVHNHVTDIWNSVGHDGWAGLIYLTPDAPVAGGLKLWRNRDTRRNFDWMTPPDNWEQVDDLGNVFNRLILARGDLPHSGAAGWGDSPETGRLFQTFFFKVKSSEPETPLGVPLTD